MAIVSSIDNKGALKRNLGTFLLFAVIIISFMTQYALSDVSGSSIYDKVKAGSYIDTGLDKTKGISMDIVDNSLTHKILEFEITNEISAQDIQLLIAENNFDASAGSLSKLNVMQKEDPVYGTICNPYAAVLNGTEATVENCTTMQTGSKLVEYEEWLPIEIKAAEKQDLSLLSTFGILGKGKYRYSLGVPVVKMVSGWGNVGTIFLNLGDQLYADKQHSSEWNQTFANRRLLSFNEVETTWRNNSFMNFSLGSFMSTGDWESGNFRIVEESNATDWIEMPYMCMNKSSINSNITCLNANITDYFGFFADTYSNGSYKNYYIYYNNISAVTDSSTPLFLWLDMNYTHQAGTSMQKAYPAFTKGFVVWIMNGSDAYGSIYITDSAVGISQGAICGVDYGNILGKGACSYICMQGTSGIDDYTKVGGTSTAVCNGGIIRQKIYVDVTPAMGSDYYMIYNYTDSGTNAEQNRVTPDTPWGLRTRATQSYAEINMINWDGNGAKNYWGFAIGKEDFSFYIDDMPSYTIGNEDHPKAAPAVNMNLISPAIAYTIDDLNCSFTVTDSNAEDNLTVNVSWYNGTSLYGTYTISVTNGTLASNILTADKTAKGQIWNCSVIAYDGYLYSNASSAVRYINNSSPDITEYNTSSLNRTWVYNNTANVDYKENETARFAVNVSDADNDEVWYSWFVDDELQDWALSWFDKAWNLFSAGLHTVRVDVNDTENAKTNRTWNVNIANVVNKQWSVDYVTPTPDDEDILDSANVNISVLVNSVVIKAGSMQTLFHNYSDFNGNLSSTTLNSTAKALQLSYPALVGSYTSNVYDAGEAVIWDNISWSELLPTDGETEPASGIAAIWHMNEQSGYVMDASGNLNNGTAQAGVDYNVNATFSTGLQFDGVGGYVEVLDSNSLDLTNNLTMQAWIKTSTANKGILSKGASGAYGDYALALDTSGRLRLYLRNLLAVTGTSSVADGQWHHVAGTYDGVTARVYVDGVLQASAAHNQAPVTNAETLKIGRYIDSSYSFNGIMDEVVVWGRTLNSSEVLRQYNAKLVNVTFQVRSCDDSSCAGEEFVGPYGNASYYTEAGYQALSGVSSNRYFQYKAFLESNKANFTPLLYNVAVKAHTQQALEDVSINNAWIDFNGANASMSGSGFSWSYVNASLLVGGYTYKVYVNDSFGNVNVTETRSFSVPSYNITFNVTSGEDGSAINNVNISSCSYSGFNQNDDPTPFDNPYGTYTFPVGTWQCTFSKSTGDPIYWNEIKSFTANADKTVDVVMSLHGGLSYEENTQLDWLYRCWKYGECDAYSILSNVYKNVSNIWQQYLPTDENVVLQEDSLSSVLTVTNDISINYTLHVPYKEAYVNGAPLPVMLSFWFTDSNGKCYNQDKQTAASNRAENPYCIPLIAQYLGPNNGTTSFKVDLHPNLPDGTYNVVRSIDIDPPVNGNPVWINYGRENIGMIDVRNPIQAGSESPVVQSSTLQAKSPSTAALAEITGNVVDSLKGTGSVPVLIGLGMICITIISGIYIRSRYK